MKQKTKKKSVHWVQSRLALALFREQQREQRQQTAAHRAQQRWNKTLRHLAELGAKVKQLEKPLAGIWRGKNVGILDYRFYKLKGQ